MKDPGPRGKRMTCQAGVRGLAMAMLWLLLPAGAHAAPRTGGSFTMDAETFDSAGPPTTGGTFTMDASMGGGLLGGFSSAPAPAVTLIHGYIGQVGAENLPVMVTTTADSGPGSLRQALANAAINPGASTVTFAPGLAPIVQGSEIVITDPAGDTLDPSDRPTGVTIDGGPGTNRHFRIDPGTIATFQRLKLIGGNGVGSGAPPNCGGSILTQGTLTLRECTLSDCSSPAAGGAICNAEPGVLTIERCTLSGNTAPAGGAIQHGSLQLLTLTASTFANNTAGSEAGAINAPSGGPLSLTHCTISGNAVTTAGGNGVGGVRGFPVGSVTVRDCIISGNPDANSPGNLDINPGYIPLGANIIGPPPLLAPLGNGGGPTQTMALLPGSPARNAAPGSTATADQRGFPILGLRDIGAYEAQIGPITPLTADEDTAPGPLAFTVGLPGPLSATSSNPTLVPNAAIVIGGSGAKRTVTVTPTANQNGTATITFTDSTSGETQAFIVTVNSVNDLPTITDVTNRTINEDANTGALAFTIGDVETPPASLILTGTSSNDFLVPIANIVFGGSGTSRTVTVTPPANRSGTATITVTVSDGTANAGDTFTLTVTAVNDAPTITDIADHTTDEDIPIRVLNFLIGDAETNAESLILTASSSNTTLLPNANIEFTGISAVRDLTVTPAANQSGTTTITVTVSDGTFSASDSFLLTVNAVNDAPAITAITNLTIPQNGNTGALPFTISDAESPATALTVAVTSNNPNLVPNANITLGGSGASRTVSVAPAFNQNGNAAITLSVGDGTFTTTRSFFLTVTAANIAPTISDIPNRTINEDLQGAPVVFTVGDMETDPAALTVTAISSNPTLLPDANITFDPPPSPTRILRVLPAANQSGTATVTVTVSDGALTATDTFLVTVLSVNDAPTLSPLFSQSIDEDTSTGTLPFTIGDVESPAASLTVTAVSNNPVLVPNANIVLGGSGASRTMTVTPAANQNGDAAITLTVSDGVTSTSDTFSVRVNAVNDAPTITDITNRTINEDATTGPVSFTIGDLETDPALLFLTATSSNTTLVPNANIVLGGSGASRTVTVTPAANQNGTAIISVTVRDGAMSVTDTFTLTVTAVNDAPVIGNFANITVPEDQVFGGLGPNISDAETATAALTLTGTSSNTTLLPTANLVFTISGNSQILIPVLAANQTGSTTITLTVSDGALTATTSFVLTVTPMNDVPTITSIPDAAILEDASAALAFSIGDVETALAALTLTATSENPTLVPVGAITFSGSGANRMVTVTPAANLSGFATINVTVSDGTASRSDSFNLTVTSVNDAPSFTKGPDIVKPYFASSPPVANWATNMSSGPADEAGQFLSFTVTNNNNALFATQPAIFSNGTLTFTPFQFTSGSAVVTVRINDGGGTANGGVEQSAPQTFTITIPEPSFVVTTTADAGPGSLRQVLQDAGAKSGLDTVTFAPGLAGPITLNSQIFIFDPALVIDAATLPAGMTVTANSASRHFNVSGNVTMEGLKLIQGSFSGNGGSIVTQGTLTLKNCSFSANNATGGFGGAIYNGFNQSGSLHATDCTFSGNSAGFGGAIYNSSTSSLNATRCTFSGNSAGRGGACITDGTDTFTRCTFSGNTSTLGGGGIYQSAGSLSVIHCTLSENTFRGIEHQGTVTITNSIVAGNIDRDVRRLGSATATTTGVNLIGTLTSSSLTAGPTVLVGVPLLAPLGNFGGLTQTQALLSSSLAREAATPGSSTADQRGFPIAGLPDIGAYEAQIGLFNPLNALTTAANTPVTSPPFNVGQIGTLVVTSSNPTLVPAASVVITGSGGTRSVTITPAPGQSGSATVTLTDSVTGETQAISFTVNAAALVVTTTNDSGPGSLRQVLADAASAPGASTITFAPGLGPIVLASEIVITDPAGVTLDAGDRLTGVTIDGGPGTNRHFRIDPGTTATFQRLKLTGGNGVGGGAPPNYGGSIHTQGTLSLRECTLSGNTSSNAAGAIYNQDGTLTVERCTFHSNTAGSGGGILHESQQTMTVTASTFTNNIGRFEGGAITVGNFRPATLIHCTIAGNAVTNPGGAGAGGVRGGTPGTHLIVRDCIISGNTDANTTPGIPNLTPAPGSTTEGTNVIGPAALLAPLGDYGGPTLTMALRPGSPARNAATTSTATSDQRGFPMAGIADIGAYEAGNNLTTLLNARIWETSDDFDGDGASNLHEHITGTQLDNPNSIFRLVFDGFSITFPTVTGRTYTLQRSDTLAPGSWVNAGFSTVGDGQPRSFDPAFIIAGVSKRFYRLEVR